LVSSRGFYKEIVEQKMNYNAYDFENKDQHHATTSKLLEKK